AAVRVVVSGRIAALTPRPGEDADAYRARAEPVASDAKALAMYRLQFTTLVDRLRDSLATSLPTARVEVETAEPRIVRPGTETPRVPPPDAPNYDPFDAYYPGTLGVVTNMMMWSALFSMASPPHVTVIDSANHVLGHTDDPDIADRSTDSTGERDSATWWEDTSSTDASQASDDGGSSWWNDDSLGGEGGDFGGGDFGGFD
nr:hypothetical protein [Deltaproteobacteria bacterium]